jgi:hypothetical protein
MNKVYTVSKYNEFEGTTRLISIHRTEEGAKKAVEKLDAIAKANVEAKLGPLKSWDGPFFFEEETLQD